MITLLRWRLLRRIARERGRTALVVLGIALGVSVFVAIRLASVSALSSFADTVDAVTGRANLEVVPLGDGLDEAWYGRVRDLPGVRAAAPIVEVTTLAAGPHARRGGAVTMGERAGWDETVTVLGLDPFAEAPFRRVAAGAGAGLEGSWLALLATPRTVAIPRALATRRGWTLGDTLRLLASGRPVALRIVAIDGSEALQEAGGGNLAVCDVATAQETFARAGRLDRIDLVVDPARLEDVHRALVARLPASATVERPRARTRQVEQLVSAFALNLEALSFVALFVSMFLVFNAVALAVVRQRRDIGVLRALGTTRGQVVTLFLAEGVLFGLVGGALGAGLGVALGQGALRFVGRTITDLYLMRSACSPASSPRPLPRSRPRARRRARRCARACSSKRACRRTAGWPWPGPSCSPQRRRWRWRRCGRRDPRAGSSRRSSRWPAARCSRRHGRSRSSAACARSPRAPAHRSVSARAPCATSRRGRAWSWRR